MLIYTYVNHIKKFENRNNYEELLRQRILEIKKNSDQFEDFISEFSDKFESEIYVNKKIHGNIGFLTIGIFHKDYEKIADLVPSSRALLTLFESEVGIENEDLKMGILHFEKFSGYKIYGWSTFRMHDRIIGYEVAFNAN